MLTTAVSYYIGDSAERTKLMRALPEIEKRTRERPCADRVQDRHAAAADFARSD